jgi:hypothetical protein
MLRVKWLGFEVWFGLVWFGFDLGGGGEAVGELEGVEHGGKEGGCGG